MLIKDMFKKPIDRDIKGVIVVGEGEDSNAKQELEEYVVTRELSKHFREFFDNYKKGIVGETTKTGVWISGFFGSGKSHFLKILCNLVRRTEKGRLRRRGWGLRWEKAQKGGKGTNLRGFFED